MTAERTIPTEWSRVTSLPALGDLTARWLTRDLELHPSYDEPDEETVETEGLVPALLACNRAGYVTYGSQPGFDGIGHDGARWQQRAFVEGFCDTPTAIRLARAAWGNHSVDVGVKRCGKRPGWDPLLDAIEPGQALTLNIRADMAQGYPGVHRDGQAVMWIGSKLDTDDIADLFDGCRPSALARLRNSWQVTVWDATCGSNELWPWLTAQMEATR